MRRIVMACTMLVMVITGWLWSAVPAQADNHDRIISDDYQFQVTSSGTIKVREEIKFVFARDPRPEGVQIRIRTVQPWPEDPKWVRVVRVSGARAKSGEGEPITVSTRHQGLDAVITVGDPHEFFQVPTARSYVIEYELKHALTDKGDRAELVWPVRPADAALPAERVTVTMTGPAAAVEVNCVRGVGACHSEDGVTLRYTADRLAAGEGLSVAAVWPRSAFPGRLMPNIDDSDSPSSILTFTKDPLSSRMAASVALTQAALGVLLPVLAFALGLRNRRRFRPEHYANTPPGVVGALNAPVEPGRNHGPFPLREQPPEVDPVLTGVLIDGVADPIDVSSVILSLAHKGAIRLRLAEGGHLVSLHPNPAARLTERERELLAAVREDLQGRDEIPLAEADRLTERSTRVPHEVQAEARRLGLVRLGYHRLDWLGWIIPLAMLVLLATVFNAFSSGPIDQYAPVDFPLPSLALFLIGVALCLAIVLWLRRGREFRTPKGVAITEQAIGYRHFLTTVKADDFPARAAEEFFSEHLPHAVVVGAAPHWLREFGEVRRRAEARGTGVPTPPWLDLGNHDWAAFAASLRTLGAEVTGVADVDSNTATGWVEADRRFVAW